MRASTALSIVSKLMGEHQLLGDVSTGEFRPLLPPQFRAAAFLSLHGIAHPGSVQPAAWFLLDFVGHT
jgi:hypothetical protein